jgi:hypothetical protein
VIDYEHGQCLQPSSAENRGIPDYLAEYEKFLLREIPTRLRMKLESELEKELNIVEENLKRKAVMCFRNIQIELLHDFRHNLEATQSTTNHNMSAVENSAVHDKEPTVLEGSEALGDGGGDNENEDWTWGEIEPKLDFTDRFIFDEALFGLDSGELMEELLRDTVEN